MPEAWKILSGMEEAYREQQLFCTEPNVHIHCMYYLKDSLPQWTVAAEVIGVVWNGWKK